ncbi:MAG TPA: oligosaccharide flippase family protein [Ignavibacteria bacterium]|nr:oligosaccharide flippase family protein [Ignavibacteria bacterium]HMR39835.1 oligosaccharide flippase family protein [Ignavibacteria bacterium]
MINIINKYSKILNDNRYLIFYTVSERIFFFLAFLIIARRFPTDTYGELITVFSIANIFIILFDLGLPVLLQREVASGKESSSELASKILTLFALSFPVYFISAATYSKIFFPDISFTIITTVLLSVYFFSAGNLFNKILSGLNDFKSQFDVILKARLPALILLITAVFFSDSGLLIFLLIILMSSLIQIIFVFSAAKKHGLIFFFNGFKLKSTFSLVRLSLPLGMAVIFNFLYDKIDILLISKLTDFDQAAYYNVAYGIYKSSSILFSFLFVSGFTEVSSIRNNKAALRSFFRKYSVLLIEICLALTIILFFLSDQIVTLVYTDKFNDSAMILKILSVSLAGLALNNLTGIMLNGTGLFKENMKITLSGLILNVILNILLIPVYGIIASAVITILTEYFIFAGGYFYLNKFFKRI